MAPNQLKVTDWQGNSYYLEVNPTSTVPSSSGKTFNVGFASFKTQDGCSINVNCFKKRTIIEPNKA